MINNFLNGLGISEKALIEQLPGYVLWKDMNSNYLKGNLNTARLFGFSHIEELVGITDYDIHCPAAECADLFVQQDKKVRKNGSASVLDIRCYANDQVKALLINKTLFFDENFEPLGIACNCLELNSHILKNVKKFLLETNIQENHVKNKKAVHYYLNSQYENIKLSKRQAQCLFYILRGKTIKNIAQVLNLSPRTIEAYIDDIKTKMYCSTKAMLIEKSIELGFLEIIPPGVITKQLNCVLPN